MEADDKVWVTDQRQISGCFGLGVVAGLAVGGNRGVDLVVGP